MILITATIRHSNKIVTPTAMPTSLEQLELEEDVPVSEVAVPVSEEDVPLSEEDVPLSEEDVPLSEEDVPVSEVAVKYNHDN